MFFQVCNFLQIAVEGLTGLHRVLTSNPSNIFGMNLNEIRLEEIKSLQPCGEPEIKVGNIGFI